jgi:hypothetical protein
VIPLGPGGDERVVLFVQRAGELVAGDPLVAARFVPLVEG